MEKKFLSDNLIYHLESLKINYEYGVEDVVDFVPSRIHSYNNFFIENVKNDDDEKNIKNTSNFNQVINNQSKDNNLSKIDNLNDLKLYLNNLNNFLEIKKTANSTVIGDGYENAKIMILGEAPGEEEDRQGIPFCGKSGQLLMNALSKINLIRKENIYITNCIFWRPQGNRKPTSQELIACLPILLQIIKIIKPKIIITAGSVATSSMIDPKESLTKVIGKFISPKEDLNIENIRIFPIYHPAYLLRNPIEKKTLWQNLLTFKYEHNKYL